MNVQWSKELEKELEKEHREYPKEIFAGNSGMIS